MLHIYKKQQNDQMYKGVTQPELHKAMTPET